MMVMKEKEDTHKRALFAVVNPQRRLSRFFLHLVVPPATSVSDIAYKVQRQRDLLRHFSQLVDRLN